MSKAILVIDIPDDFFEYYGNFYEQFYVECDLRAKHKYENEDHSLGLIQECQIKPMLTHVTDRNTFAIENKHMNYQDGYNACIGEILRGEK